MPTTIIRRATSVLTGVLLAAACLAAPRPEGLASEPRETWYSIRDDRQAYGYMQSRVRELEDGSREYTLESRLEIEFLGASQDVRTESTTIVGPDLALRGLEAETEHASGSLRVRVSPGADGWTVETEPGTIETRELPHAGPPLVVGSVLGEWLARELATQTAGEVVRDIRFLTEESGVVAEVTVRLLARDANGSSWALDHGESWQETTLRLDATGELVEQRVSLPPLHVVRVSPAEALAYARRVMPNSELLVFPIDRELPPARRIESLDVRLTWSGIAASEFELEDARQHLLSLEQAQGRTTAVVQLGRAPESQVDAPRPLPAAGFERELASGAFILPADERIAARAAELVGAEPSARAAARELCRWVSEFIRPQMIAETLSGPEVLERGTGKCTEYATLYASLARAAGIPTRVALGQRRFAGASGDTWGGHMWNEVFVGEWVPVDASANEFGGSPDLLKFVHSDTVVGTQPLRWRLTESLEVDIADVTLLSREGDEPTSGLHDGTYRSAEHGFRVDLPDLTWTLEERPEPGALVLRLRPPDPDLGDGAMFHVTAFSMPGGIAPRVILEARMDAQTKGLEDVEVLRDEDAERDGAAGHRTTFGGHPAGGRPLRISEILLTCGGTGVLVNLIATPELHDLHAARLEEIATSIVFEP